MGPDGPGSKVGEQWPPIWRARTSRSRSANVTEKFWAGNAAQEDTTGPEFGYMDPKTGEAVAGTVAGKFEDATTSPFAAFAWVPDDVLAWPARRDALAAQVRRRGDGRVLCLQEVEFEGCGGDRAPPAWLVDALGAGWTVTPPPPRDLERHAQRNERVLGRATASRRRLRGRGWRVAWTGEGNATQRVLVGVAKGDGAEVAVASAHLDAGSEESVGMVLGIMGGAVGSAGGTCGW
ncbi:hypothetical protein JL720_9871 [Aureococcus anophagefferens]|nr:hypothetical protein JL720_9871 [Aureococcus anophagefferens]